jgi:NitT/TauT family transport system substrate-binding protein
MFRRSSFLTATAAAVAVPNIIVAQSPAKIRVGGSASYGIVGTLYGIHSGLFKKYGLDVEYTYMNNGAAILSAVVGGSIEVGKGALFNVILAHAKNVPILLEGVSEIYRVEAPDVAVVVPKASGVRNAADLNGKTIAVPALGDFFAVATMSWMDDNGGDSHSVKFVELPNRAAATAIVSNHVDAAVLADPIRSDSVSSGASREIGYPMAVTKRYAATTYFATPSFTGPNRDVMTRFRRGLSEASTYANAHQDEMIAIIAQEMHVDPKVVALLPPSIVGTTAQLKDAQLFQPVIDVAVKYKAIPARFPYTDLIDPNALV